MIHTAQYAYRGPDRVDITVKSATGIWRHVAPTWDMVMGHKRGVISDAEYTKQYIDILRAVPKAVRQKIARRAKDGVTFVCFCRPGKFCHRVLLAEYIEKHVGIKYAGERTT